MQVARGENVESGLVVCEGCGDGIVGNKLMLVGKNIPMLPDKFHETQ